MSLLFLLAAPAAAVDRTVGPTQLYPTIASAVAVSENGDRVLVEPGDYSETPIPIAGVEIEILSTGTGVEIFAVPGTMGTSDALFTLTDSAVLKVQDVSVSLGNAGLQLADVTSSELELELVTVEGGGGDTFAAGGVVQARASTVHLDSCDIANASAIAGGHLWLQQSDTIIVDTTFVGGSADEGGSIYATGGQLVLERASFTGATASGHAGAISAVDVEVSIFQSTFDSCTAGVYGAVMYARGGSVMASGSTFLNNSGQSGVFKTETASAVLIEECWFQGNRGGDHAALWVWKPDAQPLLKRNVFCANSGSTGVATFTFLNSTGAFISNNVFQENAAALRGVLLIEGGGVTQVVNNHFVANTVNARGSAVLVDQGAQVDVRNTLVAYNIAPNGAALDLTLGFLKVAYSLFWSNGDSDQSDASVDLDETNVLGVDPRLDDYVAGDCTLENLIPSDDSPAIDGGDPNLEDPDGSVSDIGAFGGLGTILDIDRPPTDEEDDCIVTDERCDGVDNDCDGEIDEDAVDAVEGWLDRDGDGFGAGEIVRSCEPLQVVETDDDCDDDDARIHPSADEQRDDGIDQDCDGSDLTTRLDGATGCSCDSGGAAGWGAVVGMGVATARRRRMLRP